MKKKIKINAGNESEHVCFVFGRVFSTLTKISEIDTFWTGIHPITFLRVAFLLVKWKLKLSIPKSTSLATCYQWHWSNFKTITNGNSGWRPKWHNFRVFQINQSCLPPQTGPSKMVGIRLGTIVIYTYICRFNAVKYMMFVIHWGDVTHTHTHRYIYIYIVCVCVLLN